MSKSLISNNRECLFCGTSLNLHKHHIYGGVANRKLSEKYGCWVYLCGFHHNMSNAGVHFDKHSDTQLKQLCQRMWERKYGDREKFIETFGKSYL